MYEGKVGRLVALAGVGAMMAFPFAAEAKPGNGGGSQGDKSKKDERGNSKDEDRGNKDHGSGGETDSVTAPAAGAPATGPKGGHQLYRGKVTAVDSTAGTVSLTVVHGNRGGRTRAGQSVTFDVAGASFVVPDRTADGIRNVDDLAVGDRLKVSSRSATPDAAQPLAATRLQSDRSSHTAPPKVEEAPPEEDAPAPEEEVPAPEEETAAP